MLDLKAVMLDGYLFFWSAVGKRQQGDCWDGHHIKERVCRQLGCQIMSVQLLLASALLF